MSIRHHQIHLQRRERVTALESAPHTTLFLAFGITSYSIFNAHCSLAWPHTGDVRYIIAWVEKDCLDGHEDGCQAQFAVLKTGARKGFALY